MLQLGRADGLYRRLLSNSRRISPFQNKKFRHHTSLGSLGLPMSGVGAQEKRVGTPKGHECEGTGSDRNLWGWFERRGGAALQLWG